jgi:hypothetical protein
LSEYSAEDDELVVAVENGLLVSASVHPLVFSASSSIGTSSLSFSSFFHHSISIIIVATYIFSFYSSKIEDHHSSGSIRLAAPYQDSLLSHSLERQKSKRVCSREEQFSLQREERDGWGLVD